MEIKHVNQTGKGSFKAIEGGKEAGEMGYTWAGADKFIIDHTNVSPEFEGKGIGKKLVMEAVNFARLNNVKIIPLCPFAKTVIERSKEMKDVLFSDQC
jgi:predicted GNAT family acetyltransferase